ncbi:MAG TPA: MgtC/SapB family protein [Pyrinomonadaceae bacterium]
MDIFWEELTHGLPDGRQFIHVLIRLVAATMLGAFIGMQRQRARKAAGLRTHILVTLGSCVFVLAASGYGMGIDGLSRVIQGIVTGIGFIGAGSILKISDQREIKGLTTAASIWATAAIGVAVGLGGLGLAILATFMTLIILTAFGSLEHRFEERRQAKSTEKDK